MSKTIAKKIWGSKLFALIAGIALVGLFGYYLRSFGGKAANPPPNWVEVVGSLRSASAVGPASRTIFDYTYKNHEYSEISTLGVPQSYGVIFGEKFILKVNPDNPKESATIRCRPVFTPDEAVDTVIGHVLSYCQTTILGGDCRVVNFRYSVNSQMYERSQKICGEDAAFYKGLAKGQTYLVRYWRKDPQRAVFYIDTPILQQVVQ